MGGGVIEHYNGERGAIENIAAMRQPTDFTGMLFDGERGFKSVTPTDIDGFVQLERENIFMFFELKYSGDMPGGQKKALCRLVDKLQASGCNTVLFLAIHGTKQPNAIIARDSMVSKCYWRGKWHEKCYTEKPEGLADAMNDYVSYVRNKQKGRK